MKLFLNISPAKMGNSFVQQFFLQQQELLRGRRIFFLKNQFKDAQPHYRMKKPIVEASLTGHIGKADLAELASDYFSFVDSDKYDSVYHLVTGGLFGDPMRCDIDKARAALITLKALTKDHDVHLFTFIRRQDKFLESYYVQKVQGGQQLSFDEFMETVDMRQISWNKLITIAEELFGPDRIEVHPFEMIRFGEKEFLMNCARFFTDPEAFDYNNLDQLPKNRSYSDIALKIAQSANPLLSQEEQRLLRTFLQSNFSNVTHPRAQLFSKELSQEIMNYHQGGNEAVFSRYCRDQDFGALGYLPE